MSNEFSGSYPLEPRKGEIDRLNVQALAMAPETSRMLDLIGVGEGWKCLDIRLRARRDYGPFERACWL
ncbi:protein of unknown function [Candidatus Filomicrobium marinum]|uniref:Uncharacterized protein n=1 Tax=Candidatus Filomicrobium marinum TaxID=1608628 RepID=A0A0D6JCS8_9HYPH|nr:hypothetical protein [Candidatus Filomicrobium marinum]CFX06687.1 protein of unknown function [Candidatus Filomicrobium marinum]CPR16473.1 protein of unknown function [Candidatus Filomicrobium marinum]